jgi:hypothetical protein
VLSPLVGLFTSWFNPQFGVSSINSWWISAFLLFFVAIKNTFDSEEAEELKSTAEIIWAKLTLPSGSKLYIGSMYHPHRENVSIFNRRI